MESNPWLLDKLIELGKLTAVNTARADDLETDIQDLKALVTRTSKIESRLEALENDDEAAKERARLAPAHRQTMLWVASIVISAISLAVTIGTTIYFHHP